MTPQDLKQIGELIDIKLEGNNKVLKSFIEGQLSVRDEQLEDKLLRWKSEIVDAVDVMAQEIVAEREFREVTTQQIVDNRERTDNLEKKVFGAVVA